MMMVIDLSDAGYRIGSVGEDKAFWKTHDPQEGGFSLISEAISGFGFRDRKPEAVVGVFSKDDAPARSASWSTVRKAVGLVNTLAFAWGLPAVRVAVSGEETEDELAELVRSAAGEADGTGWIVPAYSGEPNITKAKPVF